MSGDTHLTHIDEKGDVRMVDVSQKPDTERVAIAEGFISMHPETLALIVEGKAAKGDVLACARVAGVMAAKQTSTLIPMCHPLNITKAKVECTPVLEGERRASPARLASRWRPSRRRVSRALPCTTCARRSTAGWKSLRFAFSRRMAARRVCGFAENPSSKGASGADCLTELSADGPVRAFSRGSGPYYFRVRALSCW